MSDHSARSMSLAMRLYAPVSRWERGSYGLLAALVIAARFLLADGTYVTDDSYQYLSVASHWASGQGLQTALVHFDTEQSWQRVPAPLTTFPPLYAVTIAVLHSLGLDPAAAGVLISVLAGLLLIPLLSWGAGLLQCSGVATRLIVVSLIANSWFSFYSMYILSESLFTLISTAALLILVRVTRDRGISRGQAMGGLIVANVFIGLAYWIRYAGLFLFCAVSIACVLYVWRQRDALAWRAVACLPVSAGIIALGLLRNVLLVGTWKGGNDKVVSHPVVGTLQQYALQFHHLFMGGIAQPRLWVADALFLLGLLICVGLGFRGIWSGMSTALPRGGRLGAGLLAIYVVIYGAATLYLAMFSVVDIYPRLFYPLLPTLLLLGGFVLSSSSLACRPSLANPVLGAMMALYLVNNVYHALAPAPRAPHLVVAQQLAEGQSATDNLQTWILQHLPPDTTIVSNQGQAAGYLLQRNAVSLVSSRYSAKVWDDAAILSTLNAYQAPYLLLFKEQSASVVAQSAFLSGLITGHVPGWLELAAQNSEVMIFRHLGGHKPQLATR